MGGACSRCDEEPQKQAAWVGIVEGWGPGGGRRAALGCARAQVRQGDASIVGRSVCVQGWGDVRPLASGGGRVREGRWRGVQMVMMHCAHGEGRASREGPHRTHSRSTRLGQRGQLFGVVPVRHGGHH